MKLKVVVHEAEEGGFWAEAPATWLRDSGRNDSGIVLSNLYEAVLYEAVEACLSV